MRKFASIVAVVLVAVTSVLGLIQLPDEFRNDAGSALQASVAVGAALHSMLGVVLVASVVMRKRWAARVAVLWTLAVAYTGSVASVAFEDDVSGGVLFGGVAAGISCLLAGWWVTWAAKELTIRHIPSTSDSASPTQ